jgi:hypothetical protein
MYKFLRVTAIGDIKKNPEGLEYRQVWFRPTAQLVTGDQVFSNQKEKSRTLFDAHGEFKADPLYQDIKAGNIKIGTLVEGTIVRFETTQYQPEGYDKPISSYTAVIFANENPVVYANRQLKDNFACVVDPSTGGLTNEAQIIKPLMAQEVTIQLG